MKQGRTKMPHKVRIGGHWADIEYPAKVFLINTKEELSGQCISMQDKMQISRSQNNTRKLMRSTLFHEVIHWTLYITGQENHINYHDIDREEGIVQALELNLLPIVDWKSAMWKDWKFVDFCEETP